MSGIKRWDWVNKMVRGDDHGRFVKYADHAAEIARLRAEADALREDAEALDRVREIVRLTQKSVSDAYEAACRNGDERAQSVSNARTSLLNIISEAMGADA